MGRDFETKTLQLTRYNLNKIVTKPSDNFFCDDGLFFSGYDSNREYWCQLFVYKFVVECLILKVAVTPKEVFRSAVDCWVRHHISFSLDGLQYPKYAPKPPTLIEVVSAIDWAIEHGILQDQKKDINPVWKFLKTKIF